MNPEVREAVLVAVWFAFVLTHLGLIVRYSTAAWREWRKHRTDRVAVILIAVAGTSVCSAVFIGLRAWMAVADFATQATDTALAIGYFGASVVPLSVLLGASDQSEVAKRRALGWIGLMTMVSIATAGLLLWMRP